MPLNTQNIQTAINLCNSQFGLKSPEENPFMVIALYQAISIRQLEKRTDELIDAFKDGSNPTNGTFTMDDFHNAINACNNHLKIEHHKEHPFAVIAMYEAMSFRRLEEKFEDLIDEARKIREDINFLKSRDHRHV